MKIDQSKTEKPVTLASPIKPQMVENPLLSTITTDKPFIRQVAAIPTEKPAEWHGWITIKDDGTAIYVWDGAAWRTFT